MSRRFKSKTGPIYAAEELRAARALKRAVEIEHAAGRLIARWEITAAFHAFLLRCSNGLGLFGERDTRLLGYPYRIVEHGALKQKHPFPFQLLTENPAGAEEDEAE